MNTLAFIIAINFAGFFKFVWIRLFDSARLIQVYPGVWGSSGIVLINMSSAFLNDSDEQLVIFRNSDGKVLKSMGPRTAKLPY